MTNTNDFNLYAAGFFDGEGTVTLAKGRPNPIYRKPVVSISSTTLSILESFKQVYGGSISVHKVYQGHHKQSWSWKVVNNAALSFLQSIYPFLREPEKYYRTKLLVTEYKNLTPRNGKYTKEQSLAKLDFQNRFFNYHPGAP